MNEMKRCGELQVVGTTRVAGVCRPANLYVPAPPPCAPDQAGELAAVLNGWVRAPSGEPADD
ncbi:MAG TPA: hypothetical protein VFR90_04970 [Methylibium sp.]|uniref:hypothetical protein n=1 Tax=Methylibium sp. TaxID=2067992 RepID=UPI002DB662F9|nr:hypothetical protein [Methylibium sp.]HEU4458453.1 hypothetical protein [Methylibium sp.]